MHIVSALLAGSGGLAYLALKSAVGGIVMEIGFGLHGVPTVLAALQAWRHAAARPVLVLQAATWLFAHAYWLVHIGRRLAPLFV